jgi:ATP-dependent DNA helicase RecQ
MEADVRTKVADAFAARRIDVVVATNAFGMGIDRSDIRTVVHVQPPSSIEAYYQEVGRAGRDGKEAAGLLLCSGADISLRRRLMSTNADWFLFRELLRYIDARSCRHDFVLRYFGDEHELLGGCGHCDVCLALEDEQIEASSEETTLIVKKALSAVARAQRRGGLAAVAEMLHGDENEKTRRFGFTELSTFGLLRDRSLPWIVALLRALLAAGWIDLTTSEHPVPFLTRAGAEVMKGEALARLVLPAEPRAVGRGKASSERGRAPRGSARQGAEVPLDEGSRELYESLRVHRASIARERGVPAYVVALDRTLVELAALRPRSRDELLTVHGMGPSRAEQYGEGLLAVIARGRA